MWRQQLTMGWWHIRVQANWSPDDETQTHLLQKYPSQLKHCWRGCRFMWFTVHEQSCTNLHNARKFEKENKFLKFSHIHMSQSQWINCTINIDMDFLNLNYMAQYKANYFCATEQNGSKKYMYFMENYQGIICKNKIIPRYIHIFVHILGRFSDNEIMMSSQRRCYARDSQAMHRLSTMYGLAPPASDITLQISA